MNIFDKYVIENMKLVKNEIIAVLCAYIVMGVFGNVNPWLHQGVHIVMIIATLVATIPLYVAYKILFYDSVYGKGASLFRQFPLTAEEVVIGKVLAVAIVTLAISVISLAGVEAMRYFTIANLSDEFNIVDTGLESVRTVLGGTATATVLFMAIIYCNSVPKGQRSGLRKPAAVVMFLAGNYINSGLLELICKQMKYDNQTVIIMGQILISVVILAASLAISINMYKKS